LGWIENRWFDVKPDAANDIPATKPGATPPSGAAPHRS